MIRALSRSLTRAWSWTERISRPTSPPCRVQIDIISEWGSALSLFARRNAAGWLIEMEGRLFEVAVEDERTRHIRQLASHAAPVETRRDLLAPMPGLIVRVEVVEGQEVDAGDGLVVMEAMKMENELRADAPGRVLSIEVGAGQAVERDTVLLKLERR